MVARSLTKKKAVLTLDPLAVCCLLQDSIYAGPPLGFVPVYRKVESKILVVPTGIIRVVQLCLESGYEAESVCKLPCDRVIPLLSANLLIYY